MKTEAEIREVRSELCRQIVRPELYDRQKVLIAGMSVALQWVMDEGGSTLQDLLDGRPLATKDMN